MNLKLQHMYSTWDMIQECKMAIPKNNHTVLLQAREILNRI
jgi:hypothetical protein